MSLIKKAFLETHGNHASIAPHHCDTRKAELEAQGFLCTIENLYNVNGDRLFVLAATPPHAAELRAEFPKSDRSSLSEPSPQKRILSTRSPAGTSRSRTIPQFEVR
jgi:hypothetical protein